MRLDTKESRRHTMETFDEFVGDSPAITAFFRDHDISPGGIATIALDHAHALYGDAQPTLAGVGGLFAAGVVLGVILQEELMRDAPR